VATHETAIEGNSDTPQIACTLTSADLATQSDRWKLLGTRALIDRVETARGLRIAFRRDAGLEEELGKLVAVENGCCSWALWTVETNADQIVLDVNSSGAGIATLHGMFTNL
jgi:hypothetical protein